jgi:hypothetical protein
MRRILRRILSWSIFVVAAACQGGGQGGSGTSDLVDAWKKSGLEPSSFVAADGKAIGAQGCQTGKVSGVETTVCDYPDVDSARRAETAGLTQVGEATGASLAHGKQLLVVADRGKVDNNGKTIKLIASTFRNR